jgi:hypothetical protein
MRFFIYFAGILISVVLFTQAQSLFSHAALLNSQNNSTLADVNGLQKSLDALNGLKVRQPQLLVDSYQTSLNNMRAIALANNAVLSVKPEDGNTLKGGVLTLKNSQFSGVGQIDFEADILNLKSDQQLAAVLDNFSNLEKHTPIIIRQIYFEKDYVVFKVSILGV